MKRLSYITLITLLSLTMACVPARKLEELQVSYDNLQSDFDEMKTMKEFGDTAIFELKAKYASVEAEYANAMQKCEEQKRAFEKTQASYEILNRNYKNLVNSNENTKKDLRYELERLDKQLEQKKGELFAKEAKLEKQEAEAALLKKELSAVAADLKDREIRVNELEAKLAANEKAVNDLKDKLTASLIGYKNSGISVVEKEGKIYVSLDNSLLFASGKTDIDWKGKTALLKVAESLKDLEDFDIMVEGHTDNQAMKSATIQDNWDLSVLRATSVVRYLTTEGKMNPKKIIPSGRSKYDPINTGNTKEDYAENRRIEIILTPKLDQLMSILK